VRGFAVSKEFIDNNAISLYKIRKKAQAFCGFLPGIPA